MKGFALDTIVYVSIALATIAILLLILNSIIPNFLGKSLCKFYNIFLMLPLPEQLKSGIDTCSISPIMERVFLSKETANPVVLTKYIDLCWEKSGRGKTGLTFICYEIFVENIEKSFNEQDITSLFSDKIDWKIGSIEGEDMTVIIKYNSTSNKVEVI